MTAQPDTAPRADEAVTTTKSVGRRLGIVTVDQIVSGGSNLLASVLAAHVLNSSQFGLFGLAFLVYGLVQGASRAMICNPVLVRPVEARARTRDVLGGGLFFGSCWAVAVALGAAVMTTLDGRLAQALLILAVCLPMLMVQDLGRFLAIGFREPIVALWLDLLWLVLMVAVVGGLSVAGIHDLNAIMLAWAGTGALSGLPVLLRWGSLFVRPSRVWISETWGLAWRFAIVYAALQISVLGLAGMVRGLYGAATVGALLGAQLFIRPYATIDVALTGSGVAEIAHESGDRDFVWRHVRRITVLATVVGGVNAAVMLLLPGALGRLALGATWASAHHYLPPLAVQVVLLALTVGPRAGLVGTGHVNRLMTLNLIFIPVLLVCAVLGAVWYGALGCAWGMTAGWVFAVVSWWLALVALERRPRTAGTAGTAGAAAGPRHRRPRNEARSF